MIGGSAMKGKSRVLAVMFSALPGAGHMYIGLQRQGLQYMSIFFFTIFLTNWLNVSMLMFILPIIWFYGFFDILNKTSIEGPIPDDDIIFVAWFDKRDNWFKDKNKTLGYIFVGVGLILIIEKIVLPELSWEYQNYIETGIIAILFIAGGIKLLMGNNTVEKNRLKEKR